MVVWDRYDFIAEAEKQLSDEKIYKHINFKDSILQKLGDNSNKLFKSLKTNGVSLKKNLSTLIFNLKRPQI